MTNIFYVRLATVFTSIANLKYAYPVQIESTKSNTLIYCLPTKNISASPFEALNDPTRLFYLTLITKPYISESGKDAILSKWQFSPDGLTLRAVVAKSATWRNGRSVTSKEAALGIAKGMLTKPVGEQIKIKEYQKLLLSDWMNQNPIGIKIVSDSEFELRFDSAVKNPSGVLREAMLDTSTANRMWPPRIDFLKEKSRPEVIEDFVSKYQIIHVKNNSVLISALGQEIDLKTSEDCSNGDFYGYGLPKSNYQDYSSDGLPGEQALIAVPNPERSELRTVEQRRAVSGWLREAMKSESTDGISGVRGNFLQGEPGYSTARDWSGSFKETRIKTVTFLLGTRWPSYAPIRLRIDSIAKEKGVSTLWKDWDGSDDQDFDFRIAGSKIRKGRQLWTQEMLDHDFFKYVIKKYPMTTSALEKVKTLSAATMPADNETLQQLDKSALSECSIIPLGRYSFKIFSKKSSPIELKFNSDGIESFIKRK